MTTELTCSRCATKETRYVCHPTTMRKDILLCANLECRTGFLLRTDGTLFDLTSTLEKIRLSDDLISATSPDTVAGESILHAVDRFESNLNTVKLGFVGSVRNRMQQLEGRAHFLHGELAKRAMADGTLAELVATAKQIIDLVASQPDGVRKDAAQL